MKLVIQKTKENMLEFTQSFSVERNTFQRFVIVYKYVSFLNKEPIVKDILQKIFNDTAKIIGEPDVNTDENEFLKVKGEVILSREFWTYYSNLEIIHGKMKQIQQCQLADKPEFEQLSNLFSKPYSEKMLTLSFEVVNSEIFNRLDQACFYLEDEKENETFFDEKKSILFIKGEKIMINKQAKDSNSHKLLKYIFITNKNNLTDDFFFSEIAENEFSELDYNEDKNWRKYHMACQVINRKTEKNTKDKINDFLIFNTGNKGKVSLNKKYL